MKTSQRETSFRPLRGSYLYQYYGKNNDWQGHGTVSVPFGILIYINNDQQKRHKVLILFPSPCGVLSTSILLIRSKDHTAQSLRPLRGSYLYQCAGSYGCWGVCRVSVPFGVLIYINWPEWRDHQGDRNVSVPFGVLIYINNINPLDSSGQYKFPSPSGFLSISIRKNQKRT